MTYKPGGGATRAGLVILPTMPRLARSAIHFWIRVLMSVEQTSPCRGGGPRHSQRPVLDCCALKTGQLDKVPDQ